MSSRNAGARAGFQPPARAAAHLGGASAFRICSSTRRRSLRWALSASALHAASERRQRSRTWSSVSASSRAWAARARKNCKLVPRMTGPDKLLALLVGRRLVGAGFGLGRILGRLEVGRSHLAAIVLLQLVADALVLAQRLHARALDGADVDEGVLAAAVGLDEAVALGFVEEFNCADWHLSDFPF